LNGDIESLESVCFVRPEPPPGLKPTGPMLAYAALKGRLFHGHVTLPFGLLKTGLRRAGLRMKSISLIENFH